MELSLVLKSKISRWITFMSLSSYRFFTTKTITWRDANMTTEMRRIYLETIRLRYRKSTKKQKSIILSEFCAVCGYDRKYAIRIIWGHVEPRSHRPGPKRTYSHKVIPHLIYFWNAMNRSCSKKMKAALPLWMPFYTESIDPEVKHYFWKWVRPPLIEGFVNTETALN